MGAKIRRHEREQAFGLGRDPRLAADRRMRRDVLTAVAEGVRRPRAGVRERRRQAEQRETAR